MSWTLWVFFLCAAPALAYAQAPEPSVDRAPESPEPDAQQAPAERAPQDKTPGEKASEERPQTPQTQETQVEKPSLEPDKDRAPGAVSPDIEAEEAGPADAAEPPAAEPESDAAAAPEDAAPAPPDSPSDSDPQRGQAPGAKIAAEPDAPLRLDEDGEWRERPTPDYDGRGDEPTTVGDVLIWVPRVIVSPLYLVSEYVIRAPLGALTTAAEKGNWPAVLVSIFTFGEERKVGLFPTIYGEFGFEPSVGVYFFADDVGADGHDIRVHGGMWPDDWWSLSAKERFSSDDETRQLALLGNVTQRPDFLFAGTGPESSADNESRYTATVLQGGVNFEDKFWRKSSLGLGTGIRHANFDADSDFDDVSMAERVAEGVYPLPPGFEDGYTAWRQEIDFVLDTRLARPAPGHGFRLELNAEHAWDVATDPGRTWVSYGGAVGGFWDIFGEHRVISLFVDVDFTDPVQGEIPFTELSTLGGGGQPLFQGFEAGRRQPMDGFPEGRLLDRSSIAATFEYRWPVWIWLDMSAHFAVGNVFDEQLSNFEWDLLRASFGTGLRSSMQVDSSLNLLVAFGTDTFKAGAGLDSVRVALGFTRGF